MASRRAPRLAPAMYVGMRGYFLTICCERRRPVLRNPVRAGLVTAPADYAHSGSLVYSRPELIEWAFGTGGTFER